MVDKRTKILKIPTLASAAISAMGHDRGRLYLVTKIISHEFVEVCDGKYRERENPKKKRFKHLVVISEGAIPLDKIETINNKEIARVLETLSKQKGVNGTQGKDHEVTKGGDTTKPKVSKKQSESKSISKTNV